MTGNEHSIDVNVPVRTAYNQWTQFEQFPIFMEGVEEIRQVTDTLMRWKVEIAGRTEEFDTKITEQSPDQRIAWTSIGGATHAGVVTFHALDDNHTRVMLQIDYEPEGVVENVGVALGYSLLAWDACLRGLDKLELDEARLAADLDANWEVLAEPIQTVMRRYGIANPYELLKDLTRGKSVGGQALAAFIDTLAIPDDAKARLKELTPARYIGKAAELARKV